MPSNTVNNLTYTKRTIEEDTIQGRFFQFGHTTFDAHELALIRYGYDGWVVYLNFKNGYELDLWFDVSQSAKDAHDDIKRQFQKR